jgi:signal transduction histidine kinase
VGYWDRQRIEQVLVILLFNAIKYGQGKPIEIEVEQRDEDACIVVIDHGIGIHEADIPRLFDKFEKAAGPLNGMRLGLYLAQEIVAAHGGTITVKSIRGKGSTFTVCLPLRGPVDASTPVK